MHHHQSHIAHSVFGPRPVNRPGRFTRVARVLLLSAALGLSLTSASAQVAPGKAATKAQSRLNSRFTPVDVQVLPVPVLHTVVGQSGNGPAPRGSCPETISSHTDANFGGGSFTAQAGFAEMEVAAAQYTIPAASFPIKVDLIEMIFATSGATVQTTTQWSILVWSGNPQTGTLVAQYSSDGIILQPIVLPPGTSGVNVQVSVDPGDPDQIIVQAPADGSNSFTVGYRIDEHHNQTANPCFVAPPTNSNAFPTTDVSGLSQPANNWLFGINCGGFGCPANGGWARFSALPAFCRPSGDWVIRATWEPVNCTGAVGACCLASGACSILSSADCLAQGGTYQGDNVQCSQTNCPQPGTGACCFSNGTCEVRTSASCLSSGGAYQGNDVTCAQANCPQPARACCFPSTGGCLNLTPTNCAAAGGISGPAGSVCATHVCFPMGACCLPSGSCIGPVSPASCASQGGTFQGNATTCANTNCPLPTGACCFLNGFCLVLTQIDCTTGGGLYQGNGSGCGPSTCLPPTGACCFTTGACLDLTSEDCTTAGGTFQGSGTACATTTCPPPPPACPCDWNQSDSLNSQDFFDFIAAFFGGGGADYNEDGQTTSQDFFDFLACFFAPPPGCPG
ncbi:MAG: hypothetical protein H7210_09600 [Pyrinomonadaceae bacterium]|nr:hypothetical protein [Phycisphaerales bacterium]